MPDDSIFDEQIKVGLNLDQLQSDLGSMQKMWDDAISEMSGGTADLLKQFNVSALNSELSELGKALDGFVDEFSSSMSAVAASINDAFGRASSGSSTSDGSEAFDRRVRAEQEGAERIKENETGLNEVMLSLAEQYNVENAKLLEKRVADELRATGEMLANQEKIAADAIALSREIAEAQSSLAAKHGEALAQESEQDDEYFARAVAKYQELAERHKLIQAEFHKGQNQDAKESNQRHNDEYQGVSKEAERKPSHGSSMLADLGGTVAELAKFYLLWNGVIGAVDMFVKALKSPVELLGDGVKYLEQMEEKASMLSGVMADSFSFSTDFAENFKKASEASTQVLAQLRQISATTPLKFDSLESAFKVLAQNGVAQYTTNMQQVVSLTRDFAAALQAAGVQSQNGRRILSEIPKLLSGAVTGNELIFKSLKGGNDQLSLTVDKYREILAAAKVHGDLAERLAPYFANYEAALGLVKDSYTELTAQAKQAFNEDAGEAAKAIFDQLKEVISAIVEGLKDGKSAFSAWGDLVGDVFAGLLRMVGLVDGLGASSHVVMTNFQAIGLVIGNATRNIAKLIEEASFAKQKYDHILGNDSGDLAPGEPDEPSAGRQRRAWEDKVAQHKEALDKIEEDYATFSANVKSKLPLVDANTDIAFNGGKTPPEPKQAKEHALADDQKQGTQEIAQIKSQASEAIDVIKQKLAELKISQTDAHEWTLEIIKGEQVAIQGVTDAYKAKVNVLAETGKITKEQADAAKQAADSINAVAQNHLEGQRANVDTSFLKEQSTEHSKIDSDEASYNKKVSEEQIRLAKEAGISQVEIAKMVAAANKAYSDSEIQAAKEQLATFDAIADRTDLRVVAAQQKLAQVVDMAKRQTNLDDLGIKEAPFKDQISSFKSSTEGQNAALELARRQAEQPTLGETPQVKKTDTINIDSVQAAMLKSQQNMLSNLKSQTDGLGAGSPVRKEVAEEYARITAEVNKANEALAESQRVGTESGDALSKFFGRNVRKLSDLGMKQGPQTVVQNPDIPPDEMGEGGGPGGTSIQQGAVHFDTGTLITQLNSAFDKFGDQVKSLAAIYDHQGVLAGLGATFSAAGKDIQSTASAVGGAASAMGDAGGAIGGAVGDALGSVSDTLGSIAPIAGPALQFAGQIMSTIADLFTRKAKEIAQQIETDFTKTMNALSAGQITNATAMQQVAQEEQQAISQLSGIKGGQKQLTTLLPQLQSQLYALQQQALQAVQTMNASVAGLSVGGLQPLQDMISLWQQMNSQVQAYISAGGSAAEAQNYISLSLQNMQKQLTNQLSQEQSQAVNDALQLNQLLQQRIDMEKQYAQQQFQTVNADALERRASYAITTGTALQQEQYDYNLQLQQINNQIAGYQSMVAAESQIFNIATSTNALQLEGNALQLQQLQQQLLVYKQQEQIVANIVQTSSGYLLSSALGSALGNQTAITTPGSNVVINVQVGGSTSSGYDIAQSIATALNQAGRFGGSTTMSTLNLP